MDYIDRIRHIVAEMLAETDEDGAPLCMRPQPGEHSEYANQFNDELCYRLRLESGNETIRMDFGDDSG